MVRAVQADESLGRLAIAPYHMHLPRGPIGVCAAFASSKAPPMIIRSFGAATFALAASLAMAATPALAAEHYSSARSDAPGIVLAHDSWGRGGWGGGGGWGRHDHDIDAGDVLTGILILGGIAAIASAASNSNHARRAPQYRVPGQTGETWRDDSWRNGDRRPSYDGADYGSAPGSQSETYGQSRGYDASAMNRAVDSCVGAIERDHQVEAVDTVNRDAGGYAVRGTIRGGQGFVCSIGSDGQVRSATAG